MLRRRDPQSLDDTLDVLASFEIGDQDRVSFDNDADISQSYGRHHDAVASPDQTAFGIFQYMKAHIALARRMHGVPSTEIRPFKFDREDRRSGRLFHDGVID